MEKRIKWSEKEKEALINYEWAQDHDTLDQRIEVGRDLLVENGYPYRTVSSCKSMFYRYTKQLTTAPNTA